MPTVHFYCHHIQHKKRWGTSPAPKQSTTAAPVPMSDDPNTDYRIIATADDAILAKHATATANYYRDPFADAFARAASLHPQNQRRYFQPIIKRGTHARVCCMDRAITAFLKTIAGSSSSSTSLTPHCQIVVLGAGKDTSFFRFFTKSLMGMEPFGHSSKERMTLPTVHWYEVDHTSVIQDKAKIIQNSNMLSQCCPDLKPTTVGGFSSRPSRYHLIPADLRDTPDKIMEQLRLDPKRPTLFVLECVFMYIPKDATQALLAKLANSVDNAWIALYEPILGSDAFGNMMQHNLVNAKVAVPDCSLLQTRSLSAQLDGIVQAGFHTAIGCDMWSAYHSVITPAQRQQANRAEFLDEMEEWMLIMRHYCFVVGTTSMDGEAITTVGEGSLLGMLAHKCEIRRKERTTDIE